MGKTVWSHTSMKTKLIDQFPSSVSQTRAHVNVLARRSQQSSTVNSTASLSQKISQEERRRSAFSSATQASPSSGQRRVKLPRRLKTAESSANLAKAGYQSQNRFPSYATKLLQFSSAMIMSVNYLNYSVQLSLLINR